MVEVFQVRAARGLLGWSQTELATAAGLSLPTVKRFETGNGPHVSADAVTKMRAALEAAGVEFTNGDEPGVKLRKPPAKPLTTDDEILALRHRGMSLRAISAALKAKGVDMSYERVRLALARLQPRE